VPTLAVHTGFEFGTSAGWATGNTGNPIFDLVEAGYSISTTTPRTGTYCLRAALSSSTNRFGWTTSIVAASQHIICRAWIRINSATGTPQIMATDTSTGNDAGIRYNASTSRFEAGADGGTYVASSGTYPTGTWNLIEFYVNRSANPWVIKWAINGVPQTDATRSLAAANSDFVFFGKNSSQTVNFDADDVAVSRTAADYPLGDGKGVLLSVDPSGTASASDGGTDFRRFTANGTIDGSWNATNVRNAVTEVPPLIGASATGAVQITTDTSNYMNFPMTTYALGTGESVNGARMLACGWAGDATTATVSLRSFNGTTEQTLFAAADPNFDNSTTSPAWVCRTLTTADVDTQGEIDALVMRVGRSGDAAPDIGIHAIYVEMDIATPAVPATPATIAATVTIPAVTVAVNVIDNYDDNTIAPEWMNWATPSSQIVESSGRMNLTTPTSAGYHGIERTAAVDIAGRMPGQRLVSLTSQGSSTMSAYPIALSFSAGNQVYWAIYQGVARLFQQVSTVNTQIGADLPVVGGTHVYWGVRENAGQLQGVWSTDGVSWNIHHAIANPFSGDTTAIIYMMVGTDSAEGSTYTMSVDDLAFYTYAPASSGATATPTTVSITTAVSGTAQAGSRPAPATIGVTTAITGAASSSRTATPATVAATTAITGAASASRTATPATIVGTTAVSGTPSLGVAIAPATISTAAAISGTARTGSTAAPTTVAASTSISGAAQASRTATVTTITPPMVAISGAAQAGSRPTPTTIASAASISGTYTSPVGTAPSTVAAAATITGTAQAGSVVASATVAPAPVVISGTAQTGSGTTVPASTVAATAAITGAATLPAMVAATTIATAATISGTAQAGARPAPATISPPTVAISGSATTTAAAVPATLATSVAISGTARTGSTAAPGTIAPPPVVISGAPATSSATSPATVTPPAVVIAGSVVAGATPGTIMCSVAVSGSARTGAAVVTATVTVAVAIPQPVATSPATVIVVTIAASTSISGSVTSSVMAAPATILALATIAGEAFSNLIPFADLDAPLTVSATADPGRTAAPPLVTAAARTAPAPDQSRTRVSGTLS
jgi:hypothetical protein